LERALLLQDNVGLLHGWLVNIVGVQIKVLTLLAQGRFAPPCLLIAGRWKWIADCFLM
jgi:hypothetical protein